MNAVQLSVVMAVRNGERYLREAIDSVLGQSVADFECLIVDDASSDDTAAILAWYEKHDARVRVLRNAQQHGVPASVNRGLMQARGSFIARHDADDLSHRDRFAVQ